MSQNSLVIKWIRKFSKILRQYLNEIEVPEDAKKIEIIELDELFTYCQKTNKIYIWLAVDRGKSKVVDFEVSNVREFSSYLPITLRLEENYKIDISCSDHYDVYGAYKIAKQDYYTKKETALVESFNSLLRHYLDRFNRKTKRYRSLLQ